MKRSSQKKWRRHEKTETEAAKLFSELLDEIEEAEEKMPGIGPIVRPSKAAEILGKARKEILRETDAEHFVYHCDSDGLMSAIAAGEQPEDIPELLSNRWHARREYEEGEIATVDFLTPHHPGIDHKQPGPDVIREDHVVVPSRSMAEAFGGKGWTLSWATSDVNGMATPYDVVAVCEFMDSLRDTFTDVIKDTASLRAWPAEELRHEITKRIDPEELPAPKFEMLELPGGARVAVADYGVDEAVALGPMSPCDIVLGKKYAWIGNPVTTTQEIKVMIERIHLRKTIENRLRMAKRLPTITLPAPGVSLFP